MKTIVIFLLLKVMFVDVVSQENWKNEEKDRMKL
jgi:hypothetical protein